MYHVERPAKVVDEFAKYRHEAKILDDGGEIIFNWHWPRGTFDARMSASEIAAFIMPHMPSIVPLLSGHLRVQTEFQAMLVRLATWPKEELDRLASWVRPVIKTEEDDLIVLSLFSKVEQASGPSYFVMA